VKEFYNSLFSLKLSSLTQQTAVVGKFQSQFGLHWSSELVLYVIQKHRHSLGVLSLLKCELGPVTTFLIVISFPAMNYFVRLYDSPLHFIVLKKWKVLQFMCSCVFEMDKNCWSYMHTAFLTSWPFDLHT